MLTIQESRALIPVILSLVFMVFLFVIIARMKDKNQIHYAFMFQMGVMLIWTVAAIILEYDHLAGAPTNPIWVNIAYIGVILTPVGVLYLGLIFAKTKIRLSWKHGLLFLVPLLSVILLITNDYHHLFYKYIEYTKLTRAESFGAYFYFHSFYSYVCIMVGMGYLVYFSIKNAGFFSRQSIFILLGIIVSLSYNFLLTIQVINVSFHTNVIAFFFTFLFIYLAILKFDFLNIVPIALQNVVDHISDSFLVIDKDQHIIDFNKTFADTFQSVLKISRKGSLPAYIAAAEFNPDIIRLLIMFQQSLLKRAPDISETNIQIDGEARHFIVEITPLYSQGSYLSSIILLKDITQVKLAMETIQSNYEIMREKERLASLGQLIGGIAHNLKTPIMSISGGIEGLKDLIEEYRSSIGDSTVTDEDHREIASEMVAWIGKIKPHCSYMSDIISTVKGQAAQFNTTLDTTFTLDELIKRVQLLMLHELNYFHCSLKVDCDPTRLLEIQGDVSSLVQIFDNLIINSIQSYEGKEGVIELTVQEKAPDILFTIRDHGRGIPAAIQEKVFREMVTTKGNKGTGLGLYMSYATIKGKFGGNMWFASEPDRGTTFYISIPCFRSLPKSAAD
ncbi:MAG TPA: hypothetical protein DD640_06030 [Clostridiales bacterium]|nr:hypothetical protein [Clostridiales bacterium]